MSSLLVAILGFFEAAPTSTDDVARFQLFVVVHLWALVVVLVFGILGLRYRFRNDGFNVERFDDDGGSQESSGDAVSVYKNNK